MKAERKIKEAFANMAKERGQKPGAPPSIPATPIKRTKPTPGRPQRVEATPMPTMARNNTVAGARLQKRPENMQVPMARADTTRARPQIKGGLPSGPRRMRN